MPDTQQNPTMEDLISRVKDDATIKPGDRVNGKVISLAKNQAWVDIENIGIGIVRGKELYNEEFLSRLKVGEEVEAIVLELDNEMGVMELSFREIGKDKIWEEIDKAYNEGKTVECRIRSANRGGFLVKVKGIDGFLPASLLAPTHAIKNVNTEDNSLLREMEKYVGETFNVKIINVNRDQESLIVSEKAVSDEIAQVKLQNYKVGDVVEGTVVGVVDFGVFIRFDEELEGLIHISELAWKKVEDPKREYKNGQKVKAKIVDIDEHNRVNLSMKQMYPNPWVQFTKNVKPGDKFVGTVTKIVSYGAIVVNDDDIQGLAHASQISEEPIKSPSEIHNYLKVGERREFTVLSLTENEKLYLTLLPFEKAKEIESQMETNEPALDEPTEKLEKKTENNSDTQ